VDRGHEEALSVGRGVDVGNDRRTTQRRNRARIRVAGKGDYADNYKTYGGELQLFFNW